MHITHGRRLLKLGHARSKQRKMNLKHDEDYDQCCQVEATVTLGPISSRIALRPMLATELQCIRGSIYFADIPPQTLSQYDVVS